MANAYDLCILLDDGLEAYEKTLDRREARINGELIALGYAKRSRWGRSRQRRRRIEELEKVYEELNVLRVRLGRK